MTGANLPERPGDHGGAGRARRTLGLLGVVLLALGGMVVGSRPADAATSLTVTSAADAGPGSLRQAMLDASSGGPAAGDDVAITIEPSVGDITLTSGHLTYDGGDTGARSLTVVGSGQVVAQTVSGARVLSHTSTGSLTVEGLTITGGSATSAPGGGGIYSTASTTHLRAVVVTGNITSGSGGGIHAGRLIVESSVVTANDGTPSGGGITGGQVDLIDSLVADNRAGSGGGISAVAVDVRSSTVAGNSATTGAGGGISANGASLANSTLVGNEAAQAGGGLSVEDEVFLVYSTVRGNRGASGTSGNLGSIDHLVAVASVIVESGGGPSCGTVGVVSSEGWNVADDDSCGLDHPTDRQDAGLDARLGPLADNGGPTPTMLPAADSPLVDAIPVADCRTGSAAMTVVDQRGLDRPAGAGCDIGAVERYPVPGEDPPGPPGGPPNGSPGGPPGALPVAPAAVPLRAAAAFTG